MDKDFSTRLRSVIQAMGLNPTHFARKAGVPQGTISKCLNGHVPTPRVLLRIARATGKSVDWLLTGGGSGRSREGRVAEKAAGYGSRGRSGKAKSNEYIWVAKLLKVLRSGDQRKIRTVKDLLKVLSS